MMEQGVATEPKAKANGALIVQGRRGGKLVRWPKGVSGNPLGTKKSFHFLIRHSTAEGEDLVAFALSVLRGKETTTVVSGGVPVICEAGISDRLRAMEWLADRGWGKPAPDEASQDIAEVGTVILGALREFPEAHGAVLTAIKAWKAAKDAK
jgi:hypothetical protein